MRHFLQFKDFTRDEYDYLFERVNYKRCLREIIVSGVLVGHGYAFHARCMGREHTFLRVLDHNALSGRSSHLAGGTEEYLRIWFDVLDIVFCDHTRKENIETKDTEHGAGIGRI